MMLLRMEALGRRYGGLDALRDLNLDIPVGARHAIIGPNGAGKTTLFNLIAGTVRPSSGRVLLDGQDIGRLGAAARARRGISRTWQHPAIFSRLSVAANVDLAVTRHSVRPGRLRRLGRDRVRARSRTILAQVGLTAHADARAGQLPYGLRRRLEFAVALAAQPRLLLLDEPSAGLAPDEVSRLTAAINDLPADVTVLLIDHNLDLVWAIADTVTVLDHGRHLTTGTPEEIRADPRVRAAYLTTGSTPPAAAVSATDGPVLLRVQGLRAGYHGAPVLDDLDLHLAEGEVLAVLGRNGAGKTTLLNGLTGLLTPAPPTVIELAGNRIEAGQRHRIARSGVALVPQGRRLFNLTVAEHLTAAAAAAPGDRNGRRWQREEILSLLPPLRNRLHHHARQLSGGEQQMLALARALLTNPRLLLLDEPSEGLAPAVIEQLAGIIRDIATEGVGVLLAEQNVPLALNIADRVLVIERGRIALTTDRGGFGDGQQQRLDELLGVATVLG
ncbi:MAG TPA: ATP-binding cassette domain-containing protein [Micromonosporaceae bacterium]|nr:ATP-binding cassette domain-containing protein [Micromonosporaceae bacterium]